MCSALELEPLPLPLCEKLHLFQRVGSIASECELNHFNIR